MTYATTHISNNTLSYDILFSDECCIQCASNEWEVVGGNEERTCIYTKQHPLSLMIWGCVGYNVRYLRIYDTWESVDARRYTMTVMEAYQHFQLVCHHWQHANCLTTSSPLYLLHENAPPHTAAYTIQLLKQYKISTLPFPPHSPDLNIIENIWPWVKLRVKAHSPQTKAQLIQLIERYWNEYPQSCIQRMIAEYHSRLFAVILSKGWQTKY